jgi:hypothetical protein
MSTDQQSAGAFIAEVPLGLLEAIKHQVQRHQLLFGITLAYLGICWTLASRVGYLEQFSLMLYSDKVLRVTAVLAVAFICAISVRTIVVDRPQQVMRAIITELTDVWLTRQRLTQALPQILLFLLFMSCFSSMKAMIPALQPYAWDTQLHQWDLALHAGIEPWRMTHALFGGALPTFVINFCYNLWFPVMFAVLYAQIFTHHNPPLQKRFLLSYYLCWIINGSLLATLFSSVGPCFYGLLLPGMESPYEPLMQSLYATNEHFPLYAVSTQTELWDSYQHNALGLGSGISSMPSMHVSIAFLLFLFSLHKPPFWRYAAGVFCLVIMIGSVHLGWHYAVDGYISVLTTALIWYGAGKFCGDEKRWMHKQEPAPKRRFNSVQERVVWLTPPAGSARSSLPSSRRSRRDSSGTSR